MACDYSTINSALTNGTLTLS